MNGLILEGVCTTGKTTLLNHISNDERYIKRQTKLQLNEFMTERVIEYPKPTLTERLKLLKNYVDIIENLNTNFYSSRFKDTEDENIRPIYLLERFHLTHAVEEQDFKPFKEIDEKLNELKFKLVILTIDQDKIKERLLNSFKHRNDSWYRYIMSFGGVDTASKMYLDMQEKLLKYSKLSSIDTVVINTLDGDWGKYTDAILK